MTNIISPRFPLRQLTKIAILSALCVALRFAFASLPNIQPITAIFFLLVIFESFQTSFLVMTLTMLLSSFLLGFGLWVLFQVLSFGIVLLLWRVIAKHLSFFLQLIIIAILAFCYGCIIDSITALLFNMPWWSYVLAGLIFNINHAVSTVIFYPLLIKIFRRFYNHENNN